VPTLQQNKAFGDLGGLIVAYFSATQQMVFSKVG